LLKPRTLTYKNEGIFPWFSIPNMIKDMVQMGYTKVEGGREYCSDYINSSCGEGNHYTCPEYDLLHHRGKYKVSKEDPSSILIGEIVSTEDDA
jgi:hypothetical protein